MQVGLKSILLVCTLALFIIPLASAVTLDSGTTLNTTGSNSSITITTIPIQVSLAKIDLRAIELHDTSYTNGELTVNLTTLINWTTANTNIDTSVFPYLSSSTSTSKTITSGLSQSVTGTFTFNVNDCSSVGNIVHQSSGGTTKTSYQQGGYTCSNGQISVVLNNVANGDTISLDYSCSTFTVVGFRLIMILSALSLVAFLGALVYRRGMDGMSVGMLVMMFVILIVCIILWQTSGQILGAACPVTT